MKQSTKQVSWDMKRQLQCNEIFLWLFFLVESATDSMAIIVLNVFSYCGRLVPKWPHRCETCKYYPGTTGTGLYRCVYLVADYERESASAVMFRRNDYRCTHAHTHESQAHVHITNVKLRPRWIGSKLFSAAPPSPNAHSQHAELSARNLS